MAQISAEGRIKHPSQFLNFSRQNLEDIHIATHRISLDLLKMSIILTKAVKWKEVRRAAEYVMAVIQERPFC